MLQAHRANMAKIRDGLECRKNMKHLGQRRQFRSARAANAGNLRLHTVLSTVNDRRSRLTCESGEVEALALEGRRSK